MPDDVSIRPKVLITGANGFVGSNLTKYLSQDTNLDVYAMVRPKAPVNFLYDFQKHPQTGENLFEIVEANLLDEGSIENAVKGMNMIVHLAGFVSDWGDRSRFWEFNVKGTKRILRAASKAKVSRIIYLSSLTVHAMNGHTYADETTPRDVKNFAYGESKREGEDLVTEWATTAPSNEKRKVAIVRPGWIIYGPYDTNSYVTALDGIVTGKFGFVDKGKHLVSHVYVENLCYGIGLLLHASHIHGAYNILDGNMTWKKWVHQWAKVADTKIPRLSVPYWCVVPVAAILVGIYKLFRIKTSPILNFYRIRIMHRDLAFVNTRISTEVGYEMPVPFKEGIEKTLAFYETVYGKIQKK
ncbi:NAD-dependent epimerase/dehydratase family protein [Candidatus Lokiarchaeum ossiferum]|uniref:NAD-dependent epimerase/dehydratase family protein n=1 Tax=Candidatus Lokiarchaeum ossiferum TaxID=2951803 RepID=UPI00352D27E8